MAPRSRAARTARVSASSPSVSRLESARRARFRNGCRTAPAPAPRAAPDRPKGQHPARQSGCRSRRGILMIISCTPASLAAAMMESADASGSKRQIFWRRSLRTVRRPAADSRCDAEHVARPLVEGCAVEPHPCLGTAARRRPSARHQRGLARPARPRSRRAVAGLQREGDILHDDLLVGPAAPMLTPSTDSRLEGFCNRVCTVGAGMVSSSLLRRCQLCRAATKPFQCAIARFDRAPAPARSGSSPR